MWGPAPLPLAEPPRCYPYVWGRHAVHAVHRGCLGRHRNARVQARDSHNWISDNGIEREGAACDNTGGRGNGDLKFALDSLHESQELLGSAQPMKIGVGGNGKIRLIWDRVLYNERVSWR